MTYISPKPVSLQALRTWLNNAAVSRNGRTVFAQRSSTRAGACLQFVWLNCNNAKDSVEYLEHLRDSTALGTVGK